jgi:predicted RNA binding protein YcfA (HicA-like mRNA interferase family)
MSKLPLLSPEKILSILSRHGFVLDRTKGSHQIYMNPDTGRREVVPVHPGKEIPRGTLIEILRQAGITREDLI